MTVEPAGEPFWAALEEGRFVLPACEDCDEAFFPPAPICPRCHGAAVEWVESDARGELYAFTRQHRTAPGVPSPLVLGVVALDDGPRLLARLAGAYEERTVGERVRLAPREYEGAIDRGRLSDRPFFRAEPIE